MTTINEDWWDDGQRGYVEAANLTQARSAGHELFDRLWKPVSTEYGRKRARDRAYAWLAAQLGIESYACHFSTWDVDEVQKALDVMKGATFKTVMDWWLDTHEDLAGY